jgi:hypothetical protein
MYPGPGWDAAGLEAAAKSRQFGATFALVAQAERCDCFDAGSVIQSSEIDGAHLDAGAHLALGRALASKVRALLDGEEQA